MTTRCEYLGIDDFIHTPPYTIYELPSDMALKKEMKQLVFSENLGEHINLFNSHDIQVEFYKIYKKKCYSDKFIPLYTTFI